MKRRDFIEKSGCTLAGLMMANLGLISCKKEGASPGTETAANAPMGEKNKKEMMQKMMMEKMGKTKEEAEAMMAEMEGKLQMVKEKCTCKTCPSYVKEETETGFCLCLVGKSKKITKENGCICGDCPVYKEMGLKNTYYCTRKSEMEQNMAK